TAFSILLSRWSAQNDLVVGTPVANRDRPETEPLLGFFVNTLALRMRFERTFTFRDALRHVREVCLGAFDHQDTPLELLVEELNPARDPRFSPMYQTMFTLQTAPAGTLDLPGLRATPIELESVLSKFDLTLVLSQRDGGLAGVLEFNTDLFDRTTIARLGDSFTALLQDGVQRPNRRIDELVLLSGEDRTEIRQAGTGVIPATPPKATLTELFNARVA